MLKLLQTMTSQFYKINSSKKMKAALSLFTGIFFLLILLSGCQSSSPASAIGRETINFDSGWRFSKGDFPGAERSSFDDSQWRRINLPHDWSIEGPFSDKWASATAYLPGGIGWYRKEFTVPVREKDRKAYIFFGGIYNNSKVWINGHLLGKRPNGFVSFQYELNPWIQPGKNMLAVRVDHSQYADSRWYTGSGIYRNVSLIYTNKVHIGKWGVFVTTPQVSNQNATVNVAVTLRNDSGIPTAVTVTNYLVNPGGICTDSVQNTRTVPPDQPLRVIQQLNVSHPELWSTKQPRLYRMVTTLSRGKQPVDEVTTPFGIRSVRFDPDKGFFLNGKPMKLKGVCLHGDAGSFGVAVPVKIWKSRLTKLKEMGCNAIRMSHNPHLPALYDLCDRMGFLVMDEAFDEWTGAKNIWKKGWNAGTPGKDGYHEYFRKWHDADLRDMILRDRNHPSIIMWSIGNEIDYPNDPFTHPVLDKGTNPQIYGRGYNPSLPSSDTLAVIARELKKVVKQYDTTRPVTAALAAALISNITGYADVLDIAGYNYQEYRYDRDHREYPHRVIYGSENGMSLKAWQAVKDHDYISGQFLWTGIDYLGEAGRWPDRSNTAGLLDLGGFRKPEYYFRQSLWTTKPMIYLGTSEIPKKHGAKSIWVHQKADPVWNWPSEKKIRVSCFTNCPEAELFLNGKSMGKKKLAAFPGKVICWDIPFREGKLEVIGKRNGKELCRYSLPTSGKPDKLTAVPDQDRMTSALSDVQSVVVKVTDQNDVPVYGATNEVTCEITGPARLAGMESGNPRSVESYGSRHCQVYKGRLKVYIQPTGQPGQVSLKLSSPGLKSCQLTFEVKK